MKQIKDYPKYYITKNGQIWSTIYKKWLKSMPTIGGYFAVDLYKNRKRRRKFIHRLVLETFISPCPEGMQTCHNNGIKTDNRLSNLRWDTPKNNCADIDKHGHRPELYGSKTSNSKLTEKDVKLIFNAYWDGAYNQYELAEYFNVSQKNISFIVNKTTWNHCL